MVATRVREIRASGKTLRVHPRPRTYKDATNNLKFFLAKHADYPTPSTYIPFNLDVHINPCLGWTTLDGGEIRSVLRKLKVYHWLKEEEKYAAIVYRFVPKGTLDLKVIQSQLDAFYQMGFINVTPKKDNWRGEGILVDLSDLVSPRALEWEPWFYKRRHADHGIDPRWLNDPITR